ncbi:hypothetical protein [Anaeromusa sp.]|uniref:hypothetical protein n=1 Tax=Anaeromusa sp. TaxID=1872520 RepID=UPI002637136D|nr:hypothetical protein [Anaeromusa sp.]MDD3157452.1 hypothetical protein [Anaeromusa sp.]
MTKDEVIKLAATTAVDATLKALEREKRKQVKSRHDRRLRNTRLLLKNYPLLREHSDQSIYSVKQLDEPANAIDLLDNLENLDNETYIQSIKRSATRTRIILEHIETMTKIYEAYCQGTGKEEDMRRYRTLRARYFDGVSVEQIATDESVDTRTIYRDINAASEKLSALIFGIDGLSAMSETCQ